MNDNMMSRRASGPVRQRSLQQPMRQHQPQIIRRQRSTEDDKLHIFGNEQPTVRFAQNVKYDFGPHHSSKLDRPPKVRLAWAEKLTKSKNESEVEIVAKQIPGAKSSRPGTGRTNRNRYPSLGDKATILYSRQELAERLRLAWRQREENKANIDIFLAHNTVEDRCDSRGSNATTRTNFSTPSPCKKRPNDSPSKSIETLKDNCESTENVQDDAAKKTTKPEAIDKKPTQRPIPKTSTWFPKEQPAVEVQSSDCSPVDTRKFEEDFTKKEEILVPEKKSTINIDCKNWNTSIVLKDEPKVEPPVEPPPETPKPVIVPKPDYSSAKAKRAGFQSGLNKAFVGPIFDKPSTPTRISSRSSSLQDLPRTFRRTNSAPPQRKTQVNIVIDASSITTETIDPAPPDEATVLKNINRSIKSAPPVKRRTKTGRKRIGREESEDGAKGKTKGAKNVVKPTLEAKGNPDVVTMVSLVSSADSESEMDENSLRDDKLICELRSKLPTTPIIKSSNGLSPGIRKPFKSVSFQQDSFDYDSPPSPPASRADDHQRSSLQARFATLTRTFNQTDVAPPLLAAATMTLNAWKLETTMTPGTAVVTTTISAQQAEQETSPPPTDREKRCLAVPIGDFLDKKRKLVRCKSAAAAPRLSDSEKQSSDSCHTRQPESQSSSDLTPGMLQKTPLKVVMNPLSTMQEPTEEKVNNNSPSEPYCQTPKEKECWHLYRKMCDKGVFVSFDTVLRGMLTPTEYRLRQKVLSQNC